MRRPTPLLALFAGLLAISSCDDLTGLEDLRIPLTPKAIYQLVWRDMVDCSGQSRPFDGIRWFRTTYFPGQPDILAQWNSRREITLRADVLFDLEVVAHEILHDLLRGDPLHEGPAWESCGVLKGSDIAG